MKKSVQNQKATQATKTRKLLGVRRRWIRLSPLRVLVFVLIFGGLGTAYLVATHAAPTMYKPKGTYTWWYWKEFTKPVLDLDMGIKIEKDTTKISAKLGYFWSNQFGFSGGSGGYTGIQTVGDSANGYHGKIALFSLFGPDIDVRPGSSNARCHVEHGGFDGGDDKDGGSQCSMPLPWKEGETYKFKLYRSSVDASGAWWTVDITNANTGVKQTIGSIRVSPAWGTLSGMGSWTEVYSGPRPTCDTPASSVVFLTPVMGGVPANTHDSVYGGNDKNYTACPDSRIAEVPGGVRQEMSYNSPARPLAPLPAGGVYLSDLDWDSAVSGWGPPTKNKTASNLPLKVNGVTYAKGIGVNAKSEVIYSLNGAYSKFVAIADVDDSGFGNPTFQVWADGQKLFDSVTPATGNPAYPSRIEVDVTGKQKLKLVVGDGGNGIDGDMADWADARLIPNPAVSEKNPIGSLDIADCSMLRGWTFDPSNPDVAIEVQVYDGSYQSGKSPLYSGNTNVSRTDINNVYKAKYPSVDRAQHGFEIPLPASLKDGALHTVYIYGINVGAGDANYTVSKSLQCGGGTTITDPNTNFSFKADYYDYTTNMTRSRTDRTINFNWGASAPIAGMNSDYFHAVWQGTFTAPSTGSYTFYSEQDDGFALAINNAVIIDKWNTPAPTGQGTVNLIANQSYPITAVMVEGTGNAKAVLYWSGPGITGKQLFPSLGATVEPPKPPDSKPKCTIKLLGLCLG